MKQLDKTKPYASVHGEGAQPWYFEQDGHRFDAEGKHVGVDPDYKPAKGPRAEAAGEQADVQAEVAKALAAQQAEHEADLQKKVAEAVAAALAAKGGDGQAGHDAGSQLERQAGGHKTQQHKKK